jgi:uncharacterized tellurite resistance protein B-like protein
MIQKLKMLFQAPQVGNEESRQHAIRMAAAALLIETARADFTEDPAEMDRLEQLLTTSLQLGKDEIHELIIEASERVEEATSLYEFTRVINAHYNADQKLQLLSAMWGVAYTDGNLSKYEEHLIRQVADLTYIPHSDYIHCKLAAQD